MNSCKGCMGGFLLAMLMLAVGVFFVWANATQDLEQFGTVQHLASDGAVKENPICLFAMIGATAVGIMIAAMMLWKSEKGVIEAGVAAEQNGGDPIAPITRTARSGCGTAFAWLSVLAVIGILLWIFSMMGGI